MITFHIITAFKEAVEPYLGASMLGKAHGEGIVATHFYNPREYTDNKWNKADDRPYGGGPGMVLQAMPYVRATEDALKGKKGRVIFFTPHGKQFTNDMAREMAKEGGDIVFLSGHYEGLDARAKDILNAEEISIGPYTLTGGELPALIMIDAITRQIEGVLGNEASREEERVAGKDVYTRPDVIEHNGVEYKVPEVLKTGHHKKIEEFRTISTKKGTDFSEEKS